jgi:phosphohistidine swiveling domain-containing protein
MPGSSPEQTDNQFLGAPLPEDFKPTMTAGDAAKALKLLARVGPGLLGYRHEAARLREEAARFPATDDVSALDDAALLSRMTLLVELCCQGWAVATVAAILAGGAVSALERVAGDDAAEVLANRAGGALASGAVLRGVAELTAALRAGASAQETAALLDRLVVSVGHRGPGETELANPVFADAPELLLDVAVKGLANDAGRPAPSARLSTKLRALAGIATKATTSRESVRDDVMRLTHSLRVAVREWGGRLAARGALAEAGHVFFLTFDELAAMPADVAPIVDRRRAERARLARLTLPAVWSGTWIPETVERPLLVPGEELVGIGVSPGKVIGRVRVLDADGADRGDLEPGEVLVANVTDVGWTHLFGHVAAVVTDIGGLMSHAAVVAREFGIPSVVGTREATLRLVDGQLVEVDGHAGVVRVLEEPSRP